MQANILELRNAKYIASCKGGDFMPVQINGLTFEGPYNIDGSFNAVAGVYVIYTSQKWLDVGETTDLGARISTHDRRPCWIRNTGGLRINLAFLAVNKEADRLTLESKLRANLNPTCGGK